MEEDQDDPVVKEIDVYVTNKLSQMLCLMQFPLRPAWRLLDPSHVSGIRLKVLKSGPRFEMDCALPTGPNYDQSADFPISTMKMKSSSIPLQTNYAVGILREGTMGERDQLHLTPVRQVVQMRPSFSHIDAQDAVKEEKTGGKEGSDGSGDMSGAKSASDSMKTGPQEVQVVFRKRETAPKSMTARRHMAAVALAKEEQETPFVPLQLLDIDSNQHGFMFDQLTCPSTAQSKNIQWNVSRSDYLDLLAPVPTMEPYLVKQREELLKGTLSLEQLRTMDGPAQVSALLAAAGCLPCSKIRQHATAVANEEELVLHLREAGVMVNGRWVARSDVVCKAGMVYVRDYMLLLLNSDEYIHLGDIVRATGAPFNMVRETAEKFTVKEGSKGWRLKYGRDDEFLSSHPEEEARGNEMWESRRDGILKAISQINSRLIPLVPTSSAGTKTSGAREPRILSDGTVISPSVSPSLISASPGPGSGTTSDNKHSAIDKDVLDKNQNALQDFLQEMFSTYGCCNTAFLRGQLSRRICDDDASNPLFGVEISDSLFNAVLRKIAMTMHDTWFLKTLNDPEVDRLREVVIEVFREKKVVRKSDMKQACQKALGGEKIPAKPLKRVLEELAEIKVNTLIFKTGSGSVL